jgi:type II secretory ATPase GspE/PulE/Tfp pilus assembly ATPase PilB-like protein
VQIDDALRELILHRPSAAQLRGAMRAQQPDLRVGAADLVARGITDAEEIRRVLGDTSELVNAQPSAGISKPIADG